MLLNYLTTALRNIRRHRVHSVLNIAGLSVGMACTIVIIQWVRFEYSFDRYHANADRIYRLGTDFNFGTLKGRAALTDHPAGPTLQREYAEVEAAVRFRAVWGASILTCGQKAFTEDRMLYADATVFDVFSFPLIHGDPSTALAAPYTTVLTRDAALKCFGTVDVVGKHLRISNPRFAALRQGPSVTVKFTERDPPERFSV